MNNILFSANNHYPSSDVGGSNKIIYEILRKIDYGKFQPFYLSYDIELNFNEASDLFNEFYSEILTQRKIGQFLYRTNELYRLLVTSKVYLKFHELKKILYYKNKLKKLPKLEIIHSHDVSIHSYLSEYLDAKKILSIHSKGSILSELNSTNLIPTYILEYEKNKELKAVENSDMVIFPSLSAKNLFLQDYSNLEKEIKFKNFEVVYNGIDIKKIQSINFPKKDFNELLLNKKKYDLSILNVAQHVPEKNMEKLLYSIAYLKHNIKKNVFLINVGDGPLTEELKNLIIKLKIEDSVSLLGLLPNQKVIQLMKNVDLFIMTSKRVIFDMVVLEALAAGVCTLVTNDGGNTEIITDGKNGYFIESLEPEYIAKKIINIDTQKTIADGMVTASKFSSAYMTKKYEQIYFDLIDKV